MSPRITSGEGDRLSPATTVNSALNGRRSLTREGALVPISTVRRSSYLSFVHCRKNWPPQMRELLMCLSHRWRIRILPRHPHQVCCEFAVPIFVMNHSKCVRARRYVCKIAGGLGSTDFDHHNIGCKAQKFGRKPFWPFEQCACHRPNAIPDTEDLHMDSRLRCLSGSGCPRQEPSASAPRQMLTVDGYLGTAAFAH